MVCIVCVSGVATFTVLIILLSTCVVYCLCVGSSNNNSVDYGATTRVVHCLYVGSSHNQYIDYFALNMRCALSACWEDSFATTMCCALSVCFHATGD